MQGKRGSFRDIILGKAPADLLIEDALLLNPITSETSQGSLAIAGGRIVGWGKMPAKEIIQGKGYVISPGLIDSHIHVESTMLSPAEFVKAVIPHGTTAVVADPHEVANVAGIKGIQWMIERVQETPLRFFWAAPSCVPASPLDTPGAILGTEEIKILFGMDDVVCLGEVMNYPGVIYGDISIHSKIAAAKEMGIPIDGHAPGLTGRKLFAYTAAGIETDHECTTLHEAEEKLRLGMLIQMRQGSSAHNLKDLLTLIRPAWIDRLMLATDDKNPVDLSEKGHLDEHLRICVGGGIAPETALRLATLNPSRHYRLPGLGTLAPGCKADLVLFKDLEGFEVSRVLIGGETVYADGKFYREFGNGVYAFPSSMHVREVSIDALRVRREGDTVKVIGISPGQLLTRKELVSVPSGEEVLPDTNADILKVAVFERHHQTGNVGVGFVKGLGIKTGAVATTVAHDSHHLIVVGADDDDMLHAARACINMKGGVAVVREKETLAALPLPLFGLMSDRPLKDVARRFKGVHEAITSLGSTLPDPLMQISFLSLPVIPSLKITDQGLVDVDQFRHVPLFGE